MLCIVLKKQKLTMIDDNIQKAEVLCILYIKKFTNLM